MQIAIPEGGEASAREFYGRILGLRARPKPASLSPDGCWFALGPAELHLGIDPHFTPATKAHVALVMDDIDSCAERLRSAEFPATYDTRLPGFRRFFTVDPFGNRIEVLEPLGAAPI